MRTFDEDANFYIFLRVKMVRFGTDDDIHIVGILIHERYKQYRYYVRARLITSSKCSEIDKPVFDRCVFTSTNFNKYMCTYFLLL